MIWIFFIEILWIYNTL